jgi:tellurite resistance protein TerC
MAVKKQEFVRVPVCGSSLNCVVRCRYSEVVAGKHALLPSAFIAKRRAPMNAAIHLTYKVARRIAVAVVGGTVLLLGIVMLVTPGPAFVVIPVGLAILGLEFAWARIWLKRIRQRISGQLSAHRARRSERRRQV